MRSSIYQQVTDQDLQAEFCTFQEKQTLFTLILRSSAWHLKPLTSCRWVTNHHDRQRLVYCTPSPIWASSASLPGTNTAPGNICPALVQPCHKPNPNRAHHGLADGISSTLRKMLWVRAGPCCVQASSLAGALQGSTEARDNHISLEMASGSTAVVEKCSSCPCIPMLRTHPTPAGGRQPFSELLASLIIDRILGNGATLE